MNYFYNTFIGLRCIKASTKIEIMWKNKQGIIYISIYSTYIAFLSLRQGVVENI